MTSPRKDQAIGARYTGDGFVCVRLSAGEPLAFLERHSFTLHFSKRALSDQIQVVHEFVAGLVAEHRPRVFVLATMAAGTRLRTNSSLRFHCEGAALLAAAQAGVANVVTTSTTSLKRRIGLLRRRTADAMEIVCKEFGLKSGTGAQINKTTFDLEALASAAAGVGDLDVPLPAWLEPAQLRAR